MRKRILVVDDEEAVRNLMKRHLEGAGYEVVLAADGQAALEMFKKSSPHLVVLDLFMPGLSGLDVLLHLKRGHPHLPVVIVTSNQDEVVALSALKMGAFDYVMKPFDWDYLKMTIQAKLL